MLTFLIPVCHPQNAKNWQALKSFLGATICSISNQDSDDWQAVIVANTDAQLPKLPPKFHLCEVDFAPNHQYDRKVYDVNTIHDAVRLDKGRRMLAGALALKDATDYFMYVDCDDFVHKGLARYVSDNTGLFGWYVKYGFIWNDGGNYLLRYSDFSRVCGTSLIIRKDIMNLPENIEDASDEYIRSMLGSHHLSQDMLKKNNTPLVPLPINGSIYRVSHSQAHSLSKSIWGQYILNPRNLYKPHRFIKNVLNIRRLNQEIRNNFFG